MGDAGGKPQKPPVGKLKRLGGDPGGTRNGRTLDCNSGCGPARIGDRTAGGTAGCQTSPSSWPWGSSVASAGRTVRMRGRARPELRTGSRARYRMLASPNPVPGTGPGPESGGNSGRSGNANRAATPGPLAPAGPAPVSNGIPTASQPGQFQVPGPGPAVAPSQSIPG